MMARSDTRLTWTRLMPLSREKRIHIDRLATHRITLGGKMRRARGGHAPSLPVADSNRELAMVIIMARLSARR